ncbi:MAG: biotin/lipoyl-binding protein, partial [Aureliella sp.]
LRSRCDLVYEHAARALNNSMSHSDLFLMPVWRFLSRATWLFRGSAFPKTMTVLALATIGLLALFLVQINLDLEANGVLQPALQQQVFAHVEGEVEEVYVDHSDKVVQGQPLVKLRNRELEIEITDLQGQLDAARESIMALSEQVGRAHRAGDSLETARLMGQERESIKRKETLEAQLLLVREKEKQLIRTSPMDGIVMDWHLKERLRARPVVTGQVLVNLADPRGDWELELYMPEKRMKFLDDAFKESGGKDLHVDYIHSTDPSIDYSGTLAQNDVHFRSELDPTDGAVVKLRVKPDTMEGLSRRSGSTVIADVVCGKRSAAFVWFHEVVEWVQANVIF